MKVFVDNLLGRVTISRLMLYYLGVLVVTATILSMLGYLPYDPIQIITSTIYLIVLCYFFNWVFATLFRVERNPESQFISALILTCIIGPLSIGLGAIFLLVSALVAMGSKYLITFEKKHIFNPAAVGALFIAVAFGIGSNWWVGNPYLFPIILVGGLLILVKIDRLVMAGIFLGVYCIAELILLMSTHTSFLNGLRSVVDTQTLAPLIFFASVMLVEPMMSPPGRRKQYYYGAGIALSYAWYGYFTIIAPYAPELALLSGNILAWLTSGNSHTPPVLKEKEADAPDSI